MQPLSLPDPAPTTPRSARLRRLIATAGLGDPEVGDWSRPSSVVKSDAHKMFMTPLTGPSSRRSPSSPFFARSPAQ